MQTGDFIKRVRREKGYTQNEFAEILGVSHATLSALENGKSVSSGTLQKALSFLGLKLVILPKTAKATISLEDTNAIKDAS
jgi:HTH-type transcriptional regulator/antitoxin HipB